MVGFCASGFGHWLDGPTGTKPGPDHRCVHRDGELVSEAREACPSAPLLGKELHRLQLMFSVLFIFSITVRSVVTREAKARLESCWLPTFTSATCLAGNTVDITKYTFAQRKVSVLLDCAHFSV